jgi:hypothetical protein
MESSNSPPQAGRASHDNGGPPKPPTYDVKPRLTREHHIVLEQRFQVQQRPSMLIKKDIASELGVPLDKINVGNDLSNLPITYEMPT